MGAWDAERLVGEVERLGVRGLPREQYFEELAARLRRVVPVDAACWHGLDPQTLMLTTASPVELLDRGYLSASTEPLAARTVVASEYERDDYNAFATLARRRAPVGVLSEATRGRSERSARFREFLAPSGLPFEMRVAMVFRGRAWACVVLHRTAGSGDFTAAEARLLARLSRPIALGVRASLRRDAAGRGGDSAPGLVVLGPDDDVELMTPAAEPLLELMRRESTSASTVPLPLLAVAANARRRQSAAADGASLHVQCGDGWLSLHASHPQGPRTGRVAVVIERAKGETASSMRLEAYGLSAREKEVATLVASGLTTEAVAQRLFLSPWTVQDHLKSIFEKTGTRSRRELRARLFHDAYLPAIGRGAALDSRGVPVTG